MPVFLSAHARTPEHEPRATPPMLGQSRAFCVRLSHVLLETLPLTSEAQIDVLHVGNPREYHLNCVAVGYVEQWPLEEFHKGPLADYHPDLAQWIALRECRAQLPLHVAEPHASFEYQSLLLALQRNVRCPHLIDRPQSNNHLKAREAERDGSHGAHEPMLNINT